MYSLSFPQIFNNARTLLIKDHDATKKMKGGFYGNKKSERFS